MFCALFFFFKFSTIKKNAKETSVAYLLHNRFKNIPAIKVWIAFLLSLHWPSTQGLKHYVLFYTQALHFQSCCYDKKKETSKLLTHLVAKSQPILGLRATDRVPQCNQYSSSHDWALSQEKCSLHIPRPVLWWVYFLSGSQLQDNHPLNTYTVSVACG